MKVLDYIKSHHEEAMEEYKAYLRIPSISADPKYNEECLKAANFLATKLKNIGMENVHLVEGYGKPTVYADWLHASGKPTILIYGHYDVQPADPLNEWTTPPFEPNIRDGMIFARGSDDNKGQHWPWVRALEAYFKVEGKLPVNVKFVAEGEEESGGKAIHDCMHEKKYIDAWRPDAVVVSDSAWFAHDVPSVDVGLRGLCYYEVTVKGAKFDLHSGQHGGCAPNPIKVLTHLLASVQDQEGRILIPGFYDDVAEPTADERKMYASLPYSTKDYCEEVGIPAVYGEPNYTDVERLWVRPTFEVHGITGGYQQPGAKTVIPAVASAKVSFRLVPNQDPAKVKRMFEEFLKSHMPKSVTYSMKEWGEGGAALVVSPDNPYLTAIKPVYEAQFGRLPVFTRMGGSIPVATLFAKAWKVPVIFMNLGWHDDQLHSPNEHFPLCQFYGGMDLAARALDAWGKM